MPKVYLVHDNGARPFKVVVKRQKVEVFRMPEGVEKDDFETPTLDDARMYSEHVLTIEGYKRIWKGDEACAILVKADATRYVFIGWCIYEFKWESDIVRFYDNLGNSDVPYPYAVDDDDYTLLFLEKVVLSPEHNDPYTAYYNIPKRERKGIPAFEAQEIHARL
jgi:hypothetical protein